MLEILQFRLRPGTDPAAFLEADQRVQTEFAYHQDGLMRRTTARSGDDWIVIDLWATEAHADACDAAWGQDEVTAAFMALVDEASVVSRRYATLD